MLLNDIGKSSDTTFRKINQHLEANYGFKISEDVSDKDLISIMEQIKDEITDLKIKGDDSKTSPEISKRLLVLEGIQHLREFAMMQFQSPDLDHVLNGLSDYVCDNFRISGTDQSCYEEAVRDAMKHYRSSRYRFPDELVEQRVRQMSMSKIHAQPSTGELGIKIEEPMMEAGEDLDKAGGEISSARTKGVDIEYNDQFDDSGAPIKMVRDKNGRMVPDPFAAQAAARRKGIVMKEKAVRELNEFQQGGQQGHQRPPGSPPPRSDDRWEGDDDYLKNLAQDWYIAEMYGSFAEAEKAQKALYDMGWIPEFGEDRSVLLYNRLTRQRKKYDDLNESKSDRQKSNISERHKGIVMKEKANLVKNLRRLLETEVSQAEVMMAAKGFAQELQEMVEKIGRLQNEDLPPVTDQMRETYGMESASAFQTQIYGALQSVMDSLYTAKGQVDDAVANMASTGQFSASVDMEKDPAMGGMDDPMAMDVDADTDADLDNIEDEMDDFGGAEEEEPLGRSMKAESINLQKKVLEMKKLVEKARKLREARG